MMRILPLLLLCLSACAGRSAAPPPTALLLLVDKSGGMAGNAIDAIQAACEAAAKELGPDDRVAVLAFDTLPKLIVPFVPPDDQKVLAVRRLLADGGTRLQPALEESLRLFQTLPADPPLRKRLIFVSDGQSPSADYEEAVRRLVADGVTLSTVCVESGTFDPALMAKLAEWGGGRFKFANSLQALPQLLAQETRQAKASRP